MININYGFNIKAKESVDIRLILSKAEMLQCSGTRPLYYLPDIYFALCTDDGYFYKYDINAEESEETGKFAKIDYLTPLDKTELQALIAAEETRAKGVESDLDDRIKNLEARGRFLSSWNCATGLPTTEPTYTPYAYKSGDYYIISYVGSTGTQYQPEGTSYTGVASTTEETREVAPGDYYNFDGTKWIWIQNTQKTVTFAQIGGDADDNSNLHTKLDTIRQSVATEKQRAEDVEGDLQAAIETEVTRATTREEQLTSDLADEISARKEIDRQLQVAIADEYNRAVAAEDQLAADIAAEQNARASADLALQANIDAEVERAKAAEATKTTQEITNENGKALILNERDGGGIFFEKNDGTSKSFIGVNDSTEGGPDAQIYAINPSNGNAGAKIDILKDGIYYTVGNKSYSERIVAENEIATKKDVAAAGKVKDVQVEGVSVLEEETGIANITDRASKTELEAEVTRATAEEAKKPDKELLGDNGTAKLFNEKDGGGAKFEHNDKTWSYAGVNDGGKDGLAAQIYAVDSTAAGYRGSKIDVQTKGIYYVTGDESVKSLADRDVEANELATKGNIATEEARAKAAEALKTDTKAVGDNGTAYIFNEKDGGGAKFENNSGVESFVGVNDGGTTESGLAAQIYADKYVDGKWQGAKLDVTNNGMYYTVGNKSFAERAIAENELATKGNIATETARATTQEQAIQGNLQAEADRALAAEQTLQANIDSEAQVRQTVDASLNAAIAETNLKKLDIPPKVDDPEDPGYGYPYNFTVGFGASVAADKITIANKTLSLDNVFSKNTWTMDIPGATTATAGLLTATDKGRVDNALQSTDTLILDCDFLD